MGMNPDYFWSLTYAEFYSIYKGYFKRYKRKINEFTTIAWNTAYFSRVEKLKGLQEYLIGDESPKQTETMNDMQMFSMIKAINAALGGKEVVTDG